MEFKARRVLFVTPPGLGHAFPVVRLAKAFLNDGHQVAVATCGVSRTAVQSAGLRTFDVASGVDLARIYCRFKDDFKDSFRLAGLRRSALIAEVNTDRNIFSAMAEAMLKGSIEVAVEWRPDLIVYTPHCGVAPIIATKLNVPSAFLGLGFAHTPRLMFNSVYSRMSAVSEKAGVYDLKRPLVWVDVAPPSLDDSDCGWPMRYLPYHGERRQTPRGGSPVGRQKALITFGTVVPYISGFAPLRVLLNSLAEVDADFILAYGERHAVELDTLPANVTPMTWTPLDALLETCSVVIHHGGSGTSLTALASGVPQIILPQGSDNFYNGVILERRGVARSLPCDFTYDPDAITQVLESEELSAAAEEVRTEMTWMPRPSVVARRISDLMNQGEQCR